MPPKIASTIFKSGPEDIVAVVDVYKSDTAATINAAKAAVTAAPGVAVTAVKDLATDALGKVSKNISESLNINNALDILKGSLVTGVIDTKSIKDQLLNGVIGKDAAINILKDVIGGPYNTMANVDALKSALVTDLLGKVGFTNNPEAIAAGLLGLPGSTDPINILLDDNPKLKIIYGASEMIRNGKDINSAQGLMALANGISGNSELAKVLNMESEFSVLGSILATATQFRIPEMVDTVLTRFRTDDEKRRFLLTMSDTALENSDLYMLGKILDANSVDLVLGKQPDAVTTLLKGYRLPDNEKVPTIGIATQLVDVLVRLNAHWDKYLRNGTWISNLEVFTHASLDAIRTLSLLPSFKIVIYMKDSYPRQDLLALSRRNYPLAVI